VSLDQKRARWFGVLYIVTFVASIPALALYETVLRHDLTYITGTGHDKQVLFGALLELITIVANIGTAVVIYPIVRRQFGVLSIGYVAARLFECTFILVGILCMVTIVTLRNNAVGAGEATIAYTLTAMKDWTFLLGPGWVVGLGNGLILAYMMYRSGLVPRMWCWFGLIGGPLVLLTGTAILLGGNDPSHSMHSIQAIATIPEIIWEGFLGIYCTIWGFKKDAPILAAVAPAA
jgi:hypothetical protein